MLSKTQSYMKSRSYPLSAETIAISVQLSENIDGPWLCQPARGFLSRVWSKETGCLSFPKGVLGVIFVQDNSS